MSFYKNKKKNKKKKNALKINNIYFTSITRDAHKPCDLMGGQCLLTFRLVRVNSSQVKIKYEFFKPFPCDC